MVVAEIPTEGLMKPVSSDGKPIQHYPSTNPHTTPAGTNDSLVLETKLSSKRTSGGPVLVVTRHLPPRLIFIMMKVHQKGSSALNRTRSMLSRVVVEALREKTQTQKLHRSFTHIPACQTEGTSGVNSERIQTVAAMNKTWDKASETGRLQFLKEVLESGKAMEQLPQLMHDVPGVTQLIQDRCTPEQVKILQQAASDNAHVAQEIVDGVKKALFPEEGETRASSALQRVIDEGDFSADAINHALVKTTPEELQQFFVGCFQNGAEAVQKLLRIGRLETKLADFLESLGLEAHHAFLTDCDAGIDKMNVLFFNQESAFYLGWKPNRETITQLARGDKEAMQNAFKEGVTFLAEEIPRQIAARAERQQ